MFKQRYDKMCFDCEALAGNFGRERGDWLACVNVSSLIFLISCLCQAENIPALKYSVNIPEGVFSLPLTVAGMYAGFCGAVNATFFV